MSEENVDLVRRFLNTWAEVDEGLSDPQDLAEFVAPDSAWDMRTLGMGEVRGLAEFLKFRASWMEPYDEWSYGAEQVLDAGDSLVVVAFRQRGKLRDSDSWVEMNYGVIYTVEERVIRRGRVYATAADALEAAGLSE